MKPCCPETGVMAALIAGQRLGGRGGEVGGGSLNWKRQAHEWVSGGMRPACPLPAVPEKLA